MTQQSSASRKALHGVAPLHPATAIKLNIGHWKWIRIFKFTPMQ